MCISIENLLLGNIRRISHVNRYSSHHVIRYENTAEHQYYAALISLFIAKDLEFIDPTITIDYGRLLSSALIHDLDEVFSGDIIRKVKYDNPEFKNAAHNMAIKCVKAISTEIGIDINGMWSNAKNPDCIEGQILALSDFLTVVAYVIEEIRIGNSYMVSVASEVKEHLLDIISNRHNIITNTHLINYTKKVIILMEPYVADGKNA